MSGYKFVLAILIFIISAFVWIPLNEVMNAVVPALNSGITDAATIGRNNTVMDAYYFILFIELIVLVIWIMKPDSTEEADTGGMVT